MGGSANKALMTGSTMGAMGAATKVAAAILSAKMPPPPSAAPKAASEVSS